MTRFTAAIIWAFLFTGIAFGQNRIIDSLNSALSAAKEDTNKVYIYHDLSWEYSNAGALDKSIEAAQKQLELSKRLNFRKGIANSYNNLGTAYYYSSDTKKTLEYWTLALEGFKQINDIKRTTMMYSNIGVVYDAMSEYEKALRIYKESLEMARKNNNKQSISAAYNNIGNIYNRLGDYPKALEHYHQSLKIDLELDNLMGVSNSYNNMGIIHKNLGELDVAGENFRKSLEIKIKAGNQEGIASALINMGSFYLAIKNYKQADSVMNDSYRIYRNIGNRHGEAMALGNLGSLMLAVNNYEEALKYHSKALEIFKEIEDPDEQAITLYNIAEVHYNRNEMQSAIASILKSISLSEKTGDLAVQRDTRQLLYRCYKSSGNLKDALSNLELYQHLNDSIFTQEKKDKINSIKTQFALQQQEFELNTRAKAEKEKLQAVSAAEKKHYQSILLSVASGLVLVMGFSGLLYNRYKLTQKQKAIIETQKHIVDEKNKDIMDSINYAEKIQKAILPGDEYLSTILPERALFFRPKDIVSGDFYWAHDTGSKVFWAVVDCTGHGVPGAFMSMIGSSFLNEIVIENKVEEPSLILDRLREKVIRALEQKGTEVKRQDGMDICLCVWDKNSNQVKFAGANNPMILIRNDKSRIKDIEQYKLIQSETSVLADISGNKQPIGPYGSGELMPFSQHEVSVMKGDIIYCFSDGYADQFGGDKGKKFQTGKLKQLLLSISSRPMADQESLLIETFDSWRNTLEQIDDVTVFGIEIS